MRSYPFVMSNNEIKHEHPVVSSMVDSCHLADFETTTAANSSLLVADQHNNFNENEHLQCTKQESADKIERKSENLLIIGMPLKMKNSPDSCDEERQNSFNSTGGDRISSSDNNVVPLDKTTFVTSISSLKKPPNTNPTMPNQTHLNEDNPSNCVNDDGDGYQITPHNLIKDNHDSSRDENYGRTVTDESDGCRTISTVNSSLSADFTLFPSEEIDQLRMKIESLRGDLATRDQQLAVLRTFTSDASVEIEELTSSLFTEAYNMVNKEKRKLAVKEIECDQLRNKLSEYQSENEELLESHKPGTDRHYTIAYLPTHISNKHIVESASKDSRSMMNLLRRNIKKRMSQSISGSDITVLVDPVAYQEFRGWVFKQKRSTSADFFKNIIQSDMKPNLSFPTKKDPENLLKAILDNSLEMHKLNANEVAAAVNRNVKCQLCPDITDVEYEYKNDLDGHARWQMISAFAAKRILSVMELHRYLCFEDFLDQDYQYVYKQLVLRRKSVLLTRIGYPSS